MILRCARDKNIQVLTHLNCLGFGEDDTVRCSDKVAKEIDVGVGGPQTGQKVIQEKETSLQMASMLLLWTGRCPVFLLNTP